MAVSIIGINLRDYKFTLGNCVLEEKQNWCGKHYHVFTYSLVNKKTGQNTRTIPLSVHRIDGTCSRITALFREYILGYWWKPAWLSIDGRLEKILICPDSQSTPHMTCAIGISLLAARLIQANLITPHCYRHRNTFSFVGHEEGVLGSEIPYIGLTFRNPRDSLTECYHRLPRHCTGVNLREENLRQNYLVTLSIDGVSGQALLWSSPICYVEGLLPAQITFSKPDGGETREKIIALAQAKGVTLAFSPQEGL